MILESWVTVTVDRPLGSFHPEYKDLFYPVNYGYVKGVLAPDGEEQDAYILGVDTPLKEFFGKVIGIVYRQDDVETKWVVAPEGVSFTKKDIEEKVFFQERFFRSTVLMKETFSNIKKVMVIGCPGSGKSTFSRAFHEKTSLPLYPLDLMYWKEDRTTVEKEIFLQRLNAVLEKDEWILDGNYNSTMELRMKNCDTVFFLDFPTEICLEGIRSRQGKTRPDLPWVEKEGEKDEEFLSFIEKFNTDSRPRILSLLEKHSNKNIFIFRSREEANKFLKEI